jgi:hypothetical protein
MPLRVNVVIANCRLSSLSTRVTLRSTPIDFWKGDVAVSAAVKGKKAVPQKASSKKASPKAPKKSATKKQAVIREPKKVENLLAGGEVCRKFTMTVQVSGYEYLADPVAATRRVLILALTKIPAKIHEEQVDNGNISRLVQQAS